jgi:outer membrane receptor protein involved in Fe transport
MWGYSFYVQDDWKPIAKLTMNLGLRYDFLTPALERDNRMSNFDPAGAGALIQAKDGSVDDRALVNADRNNWRRASA